MGMIDRKALGYMAKDAVPAWRFNLYRAINAIGGMLCDVVEQVWVTSTVVYHSKPDAMHSSGSRDHGPVYETREEAWEACIAEFDAWYAERRAKMVENKHNARGAVNAEQAGEVGRG